MPYLVELSVRADRDLAHIFESIHASTSETAHRWFRQLCAAIGSLSEMPERCPFTQENREERHLLFGDKRDVYRIVFRIDVRRRRVVVKHIFHSARYKSNR